jgi:predicted nucleotidyltransferase
MVAIINDKIDAIGSLCKRFGVTKLELFGSAATGEFDESRSDLDFLVEFRRLDSLNAFRQYFGFQTALEDLYGRKVDLVELACVKNPYFLAEVKKQRELVYES